MGSAELIDTHLHLIYRDRLSYPWLAGFAPLNADFRYELYALEARRCGVTNALHMEVDVAEDDIERESENVASLANAPASLICGAISSCRPERADFPAFLERALANPLVKGFRRVLHVAPDELSEGALFRENLRRLSGTGRPFDLCVRPDQITKAIALADLAPDVPFVLDHCGVPDIKNRAEHPWREFDRRNCAPPQCRGENFRRGRLCRRRNLDARGHTSLCRARHRLLWLGSHRLGQRLAGLHADSDAIDVDRGHPQADG